MENLLANSQSHFIKDKTKTRERKRGGVGNVVEEVNNPKL